jgi:hypothetical protein
MLTDLERAQQILKSHIETMKAQQQLFKIQTDWATSLLRLMQHKEGVYSKPANKLHAVRK